MSTATGRGRHVRGGRSGQQGCQDVIGTNGGLSGQGNGKVLFYDAGSVVSVNCDIESFLLATVDNSFDGKLVDAIFL